MVLRLKESRDVKLMHPHARARPTRALQRIQRPTPPIISSRVLLAGHVTVDLHHRVQHVLHVFELGEGGEADAKVAGCVAGEHDAGSGGVDAVGGVADAADAGDVGGGGAGAVDGVGVVFPEAGGELKCYLFAMSEVKSLWVRDLGGEDYLADGGVGHGGNSVLKGRIKPCFTSMVRLSCDWMRTHSYWESASFGL